MDIPSEELLVQSFLKSWSNLMLNHPLEMMSSGDLRNFG